jgi:hypothetical protein
MKAGSTGPGLKIREPTRSPERILMSAIIIGLRGDLGSAGQMPGPFCCSRAPWRYRIKLDDS